MAITYAWRIDSENFAYIVSPNTNETEEERYGYVSDSPLIGNDLAIVKNTAELWFGSDADDGQTKYITAFNKMLNKIKEEGFDNIDLLSADVYYNVDASECADLRGVGIKGIRYLGAATEVDSTGKPISFNPSIPLTLTNEEGMIIPNPVLGGKFSVYGIYMEDQYDKEGNLKENISPENMFLVYNGMNGIDNGGDGSEDFLDTVEAMINNKLTGITEQINSLSDKVAQIENIISGLTGFEGIDTIFNDIKELQVKISGLTTDNIKLSNSINIEDDHNKSLTNKINDINEAIAKINNSDDTDSDSGSGSNVTIKEFDELPEGEIPSYFVCIDDENNLYKMTPLQYIKTANDDINNNDIKFTGIVSADAFYENHYLS